MAVDFDPHSREKRSRTRSPAYPYIALPNALEKAAVLWRVEGRHAAAVNVAMQHWGYKEDSSTGYSCVAALKKFGLVDHEGMGDTRQVKLSDLALTILLDKDPDSDERRDALRTAALGPRIHAELWERYGTELPSDQSLKRYLVLERGFNEAAVDELLEEYKQTMTFAGLNVATGAAGTEAGLSRSAPSATAPPPAGEGRGLAVNAAPLPPARATSNGRTSSFPDGDMVPPTERRPEAPANVARSPGRGPNGSSGSRHDGSPARPVSAFEAERPQDAAQRQRHLFDEDDDRPAPATRPEPAAVPPPTARPEPAPWSMARKELPVPLDNDLVARVPYPMSEEDFALLMDTLRLWKKRLVQPGI